MILLNEISLEDALATTIIDGICIKFGFTIDNPEGLTKQEFVQKWVTEKIYEAIANHIVETTKFESGELKQVEIDITIKDKLVFKK